MNTLNISNHAVTRMNQRGLRHSDLDLILRCGSEVGEDIVFLSRQDADREISRRKREIQALERLRNQKVVVAAETIVTCYRSKHSDQKRMLRTAREYS